MQSCSEKIDVEYCIVKEEYIADEPAEEDTFSPPDPLSCATELPKTEEESPDEEDELPEDSINPLREEKTAAEKEAASEPAVQFVITELRERKHKCQICGKTYFRACHLSDHMIYGHSKELNFRCPKCPKAFPHKRNLSMHISNVHDGGKYQCTQCEKTFTSDPYLRRHLRTHGAEKKHVCEICDKRFLQPANLREHMLIHTKVRLPKTPKIRAFPCSYCHKVYKSKVSFKKHEARHEDKIEEAKEAEEEDQVEEEVHEEEGLETEEDTQEARNTEEEAQEIHRKVQDENQEAQEVQKTHRDDQIGEGVQENHSRD